MRKFFPMLLIILFSTVKLQAFSGNLNGEIYDRQGSAMASVDVRLTVLCFSGICGDRHYHSVTDDHGHFSIDIPFWSTFEKLEVISGGYTYTNNDNFNILGTVRKKFQIDGYFLVIINDGPTVAKLNQKVSTKYPEGNVIRNSSFEDEAFQLQSPGTSGWVGRWGAIIERVYSSTQNPAQSGRWMLRVSTTAENIAGQNQGAKYIIKEEDIGFQLIDRASANSQPITVSAWIRGSANAIGKAFVFGNVNSQGDDASFTILDQDWHWITYTFPSTQKHPNDFFSKYFGFSIHEKTNSADAFTYYLDNVVLTVGANALGNTPLTSVVLTDGEAHALETIDFKENRRTGLDERRVLKVDYDALGRPFKSWLPFEEYCGNSLCTEFSTSNPNSFYDGAVSGLPNAGGFAFSQTIYEHEPLGRSLQSSYPGALYQPGSSHLSKVSYSTTNSLGESDLGTDRSNPSNSLNPIYSYTHERDENGLESMQWKDQLGNIIKSSVYNSIDNKFVSSYAVFDDRGNMTISLPPISCKDRNQNPTPVENCVSPVEYQIDHLGQVIKESSPDFGEIRRAFNVAGQLRAKQDSKQRGNSEFTVYKYDALSRQTEAGIYKGDFEELSSERFIDNVLVGSMETESISKLVFHKLENGYNSAKNLVSAGERSDPLDIFQVFYSNEEFISPAVGVEIVAPADLHGNPVELDLHGVETGSATYLELVSARSGSGTGQGIDDASWPRKSSKYQLQVKNIYDEIENLPPEVKRGETAFIVPAGTTAGFSYGRQVATINYNPHLAFMWPSLERHIVASTFEYDPLGNVVSQYLYNGIPANPNYRLQELDATYDQLNRGLTKTVWKNPAGTKCTDMSAYERFEFGAYGQLNNVYGNAQSDCSQEIRIASYTYTPGGQKLQEELGETGNNVLTSYSYHPRGWLTGLSSQHEICTDDGDCHQATLYSENLHYDAGLTTGLTTVQFNGSIAEKLYYFGQTDENRSFAFSYDGLGRLTRSFYNADKTNADFLDEEVKYLDDGRIKSMSRGNMSQSVSQPYKYTSSTNKLKCVDDIIDKEVTFRKDRSCLGGADHYLYDENGNRLNSDQVNSMDYDWRNMPWRMNYSGGQVIMVYDGNGARVSKVDIASNNPGPTNFTEAKHYVMGQKEIREYGNGNSDIEISNLFGNGLLGRTLFGGGNEYYIKDHLGNTVTKYSTESSMSNEGIYDYFPFGKQIQVIGDGKPSVSETFTGKEFDDFVGLYYFGARYYDANIGMWISPDPARQYASPYVYSSSPINTVDPDGNYDAWVHWLGAFFGSLTAGESFGDSWSIANHSVAIDFAKGSQADNVQANTIHAMQMTGEGLSDNEVYSRSNDLSLKILSGQMTDNPVVDNYLSKHGNTRNARIGIAIHINQDMDAHHGAPMDEHLSFRHPFLSAYRILNDANPLHIPLASGVANQVIKTERDVR